MNNVGVMRDKFRQSGVGKWFYGREVSEQRIIAGVAFLVVLAVLWSAIWKPVSDWREVEMKRKHSAQQLHDWIRSNEQKARQVAQAGPERPAGRSLIPVITKAADAHELKLNRLQPESNGVISVVLQKQSFNKIVAWIAQLEENNGVYVQRASFDSDDAPGYVNAQIRLN